MLSPGGAISLLKILYTSIHHPPTVCPTNTSTSLERTGVFATTPPDSKRKTPAKVSVVAEVTPFARYSASNNANASFTGVVTLIVKNVNGKKLFPFATDWYIVNKHHF